jgi:retron-type reverse transcriptase
MENIDDIGNLTSNIWEGTVSKSELSGLLCNIYLNELDNYLEDLKKKHDRVTGPKKRESYDKAAAKVR